MKFEGHSVAWVFLLLLFLYVIMRLIWTTTHRCETAESFWLQPRWPLLWSFAFAFLLLFHWAVLQWGTATLGGAVRWSDHAILAAILLGILLVARSMFDVWSYVRHENHYLSGLRFGPVHVNQPQHYSRVWSNNAFLGWQECEIEPSRSYDKYQPAFEPWPENAGSWPYLDRQIELQQD